MVFRFPVKSSETEVQQISLHMKDKKVSNSGPLVAKNNNVLGINYYVIIIYYL